jgi:transketolase
MSGWPDHRHRHFGASAPAPVLYDHFGLTAEKIVPQVLERLG